MMSSSTTDLCFNSYCKEASDKWRRGWRRRIGDYAQLCDRCASAYENGKFCETFHLNASGWRCCESCGKQIHCGCIVSFHMFVLLDAGGIECLSCARKSYILTPNPAWPPPLDCLPSQPERMKDLSAKTWSSIAGSGPVPWHQAPSLFNGSDIQSNVQLRMPFEMGVSDGTDRNPVCDRLSTALPEMRKGHSRGRLFNEKLRLGPSETLQNGNTAGLDIIEQPCPFVNDIKTVNPKTDFSSTLNLPMVSSSRIEADNAHYTSISEPAFVSTCGGKSCCSHGGMGSFGEPQTCSRKARGDGRGRSQLVSRYHPQMTEEELQQISGDSKSVITPLFEKMLSASDAGRIGRLILPKRCAEVYFPQITHPEGLPLQVQDVKGKEWVFQFRFWPNNNSRMYVLEGITPCIQSMQLQAGDVVTFSRLEPEGKLVMGCRKNSAVPSLDQRDEENKVGADFSNVRDGSPGNEHGDVVSVNGHTKEKMLEDKPIVHTKRKNNSFGSKNKRLRIENEDVVELKLTWKEAQGLMRPPATICPSVFVVEGCEFEEFEEAAPVIGRPTIPGIDLIGIGAKTQWIQCEDCFKWRKVPAAALLPSRWVCSENVWNLDRSQCSSAEELTKEELVRMLRTTNKESSKEKEITSQLRYEKDGFRALLNLAIKGVKEGRPSSSENSTKHPRHKPGCACIVCLQPPSGAKHEESCECVVCSCLKRRFKTQVERKERKLLKKKAETLSQDLQTCFPQLLGETKDLDNSSALYQEPVSKDGNIDEPNTGISSNSPLKGHIDLNIQPDKEENMSLSSGPGGPINCMERYFTRFFGF